MSNWLPEVEGWVKVAGILVGVVMAVLVPVRSWVVEDRRYRAQMLEAAAAAGRAGPPACPGGGASCGPTGAEGLAAALRDCAAAIREASRAEEARGHERLARALDRFVDHA